MRPSFSRSFRALDTPSCTLASGQLLAGCLLVVSFLLLGGCHSAPEPAATGPAPSNITPVPNTALQQAANAPNVPADEKQKLAESLARSQAAAKDPRLLKGRPVPTPH